MNKLSSRKTVMRNKVEMRSYTTVCEVSVSASMYSTVGADQWFFQAEVLVRSPIKLYIFLTYKENLDSSIQKNVLLNVGNRSAGDDMSV